jgi:hypothetical protein
MSDPTAPARSDAGPAHGARRLLAHPLLGPLPPAAEVDFTLDGRPLSGRAGEPVLAALLAAGVRVCRTMPRSGEARGGYCLIGRCADCLMQVDGEPNVRTCLTPLRAGLRVVTQRGLGAWEMPAAAEAAAPDREREEMP